MQAAIRWIFLLLLVSLMGAGLSAGAQYQSTPIPRDPPDIHPQYFPHGVFQDSSETGWFRGFKERWYAKHLRSMSEPSLFEGSKDTTLVAYRFLWLRTFHHPIALRLTIHVDGTGTLSVKETDGHGGYGAGRIIQNESSEIAKPQTTELLGLVQTTGFWSLPTEEMSGGNDGAQWILEGVENGHYHVVDRWSPKDSNYQRLCLYLLERSKLKVKTDEIY